jgi:hypothetical protein
LTVFISVVGNVEEEYPIVIFEANQSAKNFPVCKNSATNYTFFDKFYQSHFIGNRFWKAGEVFEKLNAEI